MRKPLRRAFLLLVVLAACARAGAGDVAGHSGGILAALSAAPQIVARETPVAKAAEAAPGNPVVVVETSKGTIKIELFPEAAPKTVENFLTYVDGQFYKDTIFHRVIRGFVVQGGGFTPELELKPTLPPVRIESKNGLVNQRGTVAMARTLDKDSATSQFFINLSDNQQLNRGTISLGYTVFGRVIEGMNVVDRISQVQTSRRGKMDDVPIIPVFIESVRREQP